MDEKEEAAPVVGAETNGYDLPAEADEVTVEEGE